MHSYEAYRTTVELTDSTLEIHRVGLTAKAVAAHVSVPLDAIEDARLTKATALVNGMLQVVLHGTTPGKAQPSDPYTVVFRRKQGDGIAELKLLLDNARAQREAAGRPPVVVDPISGRVAGLAARAAERSGAPLIPGDADFFAGVRIAGDRVTHTDGGGPVAGATAVVETAGEMRRRITASRIVLTGVFALAWRKKIDDRELYMLVNGVGWAIAVPVPPKLGAEARAFAARINAAGSAPGPEPVIPAGGESPLQQLERLAELRDRGVLTGDEFDEKKRELLDRI